MHSLLFKAHDSEFFSEDIGRHNCFDKVTGMLLREGRLSLVSGGVVYISGRVTSEIMMKAVRIDVPVIVSKSTPSLAAIKLAHEYDVTLLGYVIGDHGFVYSGADRLTHAG